MIDHAETYKLKRKITNSKEILKHNCYVANLLDIDETIMINLALDFAIKCMDFVEDELLYNTEESKDKVIKYFSQK